MGRLTYQKPNNRDKFSSIFLFDFDLLDIRAATGGSTSNPSYTYKWVYNKKAKERFHLPVCFRREVDNDPEDEKHFRLKQQTHSFIYENFYLCDNNDCKFLTTTELQQKHNPFRSHMNSEDEIIYYTLDVCAIRMSDNQVFDFEIDGKEHYTGAGMRKGKIRDAWLEDRYGVITLRIDKNEKEPPYKKISDILLNSEYVKRKQNENFKPRKKKDYF